MIKTEKKLADNEGKWYLSPLIYIMCLKMEKSFS